MTAWNFQVHWSFCNRLAREASPTLLDTQRPRISPSGQNLDFNSDLLLPTAVSCLWLFSLFFSPPISSRWSDNMLLCLRTCLWQAGRMKCLARSLPARLLSLLAFFFPPSVLPLFLSILGSKTQIPWEDYSVYSWQKRSIIPCKQEEETLREFSDSGRAGYRGMVTVLGPECFSWRDV